MLRADTRSKGDEMSEIVTTQATAVDRFLDSVCDPTADTRGIFSDDAVLDAVVPDWHFMVAGGDAVRAQLAEWFADPAAFESLTRTPLPDGELVQFDLSWSEEGIPFACRQVHVLEVRGDQIVRDNVWCGGRWDAARLAQMGAAHADA